MQLDLFAEPAPTTTEPAVIATAGTTATDAVATIATLPEQAPAVAEAAALAVTNFKGYAARALQLLVQDVKRLGRAQLLQGRFYNLSYDRAACLANQIAHGTTSERFIAGKELGTVLCAVRGLPQWLERRDAAIVRAAELPSLEWVRDAPLEDVTVAYANAVVDYKEVKALGLYGEPLVMVESSALTIGEHYAWFFQRCRDRGSLARLRAATSPLREMEA